MCNVLKAKLLIILYPLLIAHQIKRTVFACKDFVHESSTNSLIPIFWNDKPRCHFARPVLVNFYLPEPNDFSILFSNQKVRPMQISWVEASITDQRGNSWLVRFYCWSNDDRHTCSRYIDSLQTFLIVSNHGIIQIGQYKTEESTPPFYCLVLWVECQASKNVVKCNEMSSENKRKEEGVFHD